MDDLNTIIITNSKFKSTGVSKMLDWVHQTISETQNALQFASDSNVK